MDSSAGVRALLVAVLVAPFVAMSAVLCVLGGAGAQGATPSGICGAGGTGQQIGDVVLDAEQVSSVATIVSVVTSRQLPPYAAVVAVATAYTESKLRNSTAQTDHDSEGLFQQRVSIYGKQVADDPVQATGAFLDRLVQLANWQMTAVGVDAQAVQISAFPDRYEPNADLAQQLVGAQWPVASVSTLSPVLCAGGDGAVPLAGGHGDNVAGTTTIPLGLTLNGSVRGNAAAQFALQQLGKSYVFAAAGPDSYDCSGLTMAAWATQGVPLPHLAAAQATSGTPEPINLSQAVSGDLVLIPGSDGTAAEPGHVGIVIGYTLTVTADGQPARDVWLEQAPGWEDLPLELTEATEWTGQVVGVRHIA